MILVRHLEGDPTTIVATTRDGVDWKTRRGSLGDPAVRSVRGRRCTDWLQAVERADGVPGLELVASADGLAWETRRQLPQQLAQAEDAVVNGDVIVLCGAGRGPVRAAGRLRSLGRRGPYLGAVGRPRRADRHRAVQGIAPLGQGLVAIVAGPREGESIAITSADGSSWTRRPELVPSGGTAVAGIGGTVAVAGITDSGAAIAVSRDGASWETVPVPHVDGWIHELVETGSALVAPVAWSQPEGGMQVSDFLVSADGRTWRSDGLPLRMKDWQNMTFLPVEGGLVVMGGDPGTMMLGRVVAADVQGPTPVPAGSPDQTAAPAQPAAFEPPAPARPAPAVAARVPEVTVSAPGGPPVVATRADPAGHDVGRSTMVIVPPYMPMAQV